MAVSRLWRHLTRLDRAIVVLSLAVSIGLLAAIGLRPPGQAVVVERDGEVIFKAPLADRRTVSLTGPLGESRLEIDRGAARITASPCPYKICIGMGEIRRRGEIVACVPNRLLVQVVGGGPTEGERNYDLLSR